MSETDDDLAAQIAALATALQQYQDGVLNAVALDRQALLNALSALGEIDTAVEEKVLSLVGEPSSYFNNLTQLIKDILAGMPDLSGFEHTVSDRFMLDTPADIKFSGATAATDSPIVYTLSNPVNCAVVKYELAADESVQLTPLEVGDGSITVTAAADGIAAAPVTLRFNVIAAEISMDNFSNTVSSSYQSGERATVQFSGAVSSDGSPVTYHLRELIGITAGTAEVADGVSVAIEITGNAGTQASMAVTPVAGDIEGEAQAIIINVSSASIDMSGFQHTIASSYIQGQQATVQFSGATSSGEEAVTYRLSNLVGCTVSKAEDIASGESVQLDITGSTGLVGVRAESGSAESSIEYISFSISTAMINRPSITAPGSGTTGVSLRPVLTSSAFGMTPVGTDQHNRSRWKITRTDGQIVWQSDAVNSLTAISVPQDLPSDEQLDLYVQHESKQFGWSEWSEPSRIKTKIAGGVGHVHPDGGIEGPVHNGRRLIVAPASSRAKMQHGLNGTGTPLPDRPATISDLNQRPDVNSGSHNTDVLMQYRNTVAGGVTGSLAARHCRSFGSKWFLPNKDEMKAIVQNADAINAADTSSGFKLNGGNTFWTSTEIDAWRSVTVLSDGRFDFSTRNADTHVVCPVYSIEV